MVYDYEAFKRDVYALTDINLDLYKEKQMKRRIESLIGRHGYRDFESFMQGLRKDTDLLDAFINHLTINVSEFYRNPRQWEFFENEILPYLMEKYGDRLTVWSAACSTGDEPYTIAMIMAKHLPLTHIKIYATDIDEAVLKKAQLGIYSERSLADLPRDFFNQHFKKVSNGKFYQISDEIKHCVEFKKHNLLEDKYLSDCHLVVCRNVVIYFTDEAKEMVYKGFHRALVRDGILFIGSTEQIIDARSLGFAPFKSFFYQSVPIGSSAEAEISHFVHSVPEQNKEVLSAHKVSEQNKEVLSAHKVSEQNKEARPLLKSTSGQRSGTLASRSTSGQRSGTLASRSTSGQRSGTLTSHDAVVQERKNKTSHIGGHALPTADIRRHSMTEHTGNLHASERTSLSQDGGTGRRNSKK
ncbi:MAG: protein-glutamate O-methyltransferase CheR [Lachnospiraceae bacterium]|nr:protein-glutamate O-methyltransferase CheR [Lachnospiraceae bacterium]